MEHSKNANFESESSTITCKNGYTSTEVFMESFGNDDAIRNCEGCPAFDYNCGICTCKKFS